MDPRVAPVTSSTSVEIPPGFTVNNHAVPNTGTRYQPGAGRHTYEKPRIISNERVKPQDASRYRQYMQRWQSRNPAISRNVGREAETSFSNPPRTGGNAWEDISRASEGIRQRRPVSGQGSSNASGSNVYGSTGPRGDSHAIDIAEPFELSETVPLLEGASAGGLSAVGSSGLATGAATVAGGLVAGGVTAAVVNRIKEKGAVLPGTNYVGPGNSIQIDAPKHEADAIAKDHDVGYAEAVQSATRHNQYQSRSEQFELFKAQIESLDSEAIRKFKDHWLREGKWQSFVGRWGLEAKRFLEQLKGSPIYPSFPGKCDLWDYHLMSEIIGDA